MGLFETLKDVVTIVQKSDNVDLLKQLLALQAQAQEMQEESRRLREKVSELEAALDFAKKLHFKAPFYYADEDGIPFCARCWEADRRGIHLKEDWNGRRWECYQCGKVYVLERSH